MAEMVSVAELRDFLGVDADSDGIISRARATALGSLKVSTGIDWALQKDDARVDIAAEAVQIMVWLSFYAVRGDAGNTAFLQQRLTYLILQLKFGEEITDAEEQQSDVAAT